MDNIGFILLLVWLSVQGCVSGPINRALLTHRHSHNDCQEGYMWFGCDNSALSNNCCFYSQPGMYVTGFQSFSTPCPVGTSHNLYGQIFTNSDECKPCSSNHYTIKEYYRVDCNGFMSDQCFTADTAAHGGDCKWYRRLCHRCPNGYTSPSDGTISDVDANTAVTRNGAQSKIQDTSIYDESNWLTLWSQYIGAVPCPGPITLQGTETGCVACPAGKTRDGSANSCSNCPKGKYEDPDAKATATTSTEICKQCPVGKNSVAGVSTRDNCVSDDRLVKFEQLISNGFQPTDQVCPSGYVLWQNVMTYGTFGTGNDAQLFTVEGSTRNNFDGSDINGRSCFEQDSNLALILPVTYDYNNGAISGHPEIERNSVDELKLLMQNSSASYESLVALCANRADIYSQGSGHNHAGCVCCPALPGYFSSRPDWDSNTGGDFHTNFMTATLCEAGTYTATYGQTECSVCEKNTYATTGSTTCLNCPIGRETATDGTGSKAECCVENAVYLETTEKCECNMGFYRSQVDLLMNDPEFCAECPVNMTTTQAGAKSILECRCPSGKGFFSEGLGQGCELCEAGKYAGPSLYSPCLSCEAGKYQNLNGQDQCQKCDHGTYALSIGNKGCTSCPAGKYTDSAICFSIRAELTRGGDDIDDCDSWNETQTKECLIPECADQESDCVDCPTGKYTTGNGEEDCLSCADGQGVRNNQCEDCEAGKYSLTDVSNALHTDGVCQYCPQHQIPNIDSTGCVNCDIMKTFHPSSSNTTCTWCNDIKPGFLKNSEINGAIASQYVTGCFGCNWDLSNKYMDSLSRTCITCPNGKFTLEDSGIIGVEACQPCGQCNPQEYRTGCGIVAGVAADGHCTSCEECGEGEKLVGCINQQGHNDARGECKKTEFVTRTPLCPYHEYNDDWEIQRTTQFGLGGFMFTEVFGRDENHTDFQCRLPCDGTRFPDFDTGYCAGPFSCDVPSCTMQSDDDVAGLTNLEARGCPKEDIVDGDSDDTIRDKMRGQCETCEDCIGRGCARECSQLKCEVGEIWDFSEARVRNKCKSCQELRDASLCQDGFQDSHLLGTDISGNRPKFEFTNCQHKRDTNAFIEIESEVTHYRVGYGNCSLCGEEDFDTCNDGDYHASCDDEIGCLLCHPHGGVEVTSSHYTTTDGVKRPLYCQVAACANTGLTGVDEWGVFCGTECETIECEASETTLPCLLPHPKRCKEAYPVQRAGQTKVNNVPAHANVLERQNSDHLFSNFENLLMPLSSTLSENLHQCVWNVMGITDNDMNPGGVAHSFLPHSEVVESNQLSDGTKFCHPWSERKMEVEYPLLPLQNTVTDTASTFQRRVLVNTSARVMNYRYSGEGYVSDEFNVPDVSVTTAFTSEFTGDFFLDLDVTRAPRASLAVFIPDDRNLSSVSWVPQWELSVLVRESTDVSGLPELTLTLDVGSLESKMTIDLSLFEKTEAGRYVHGLWVHDEFNNVFPQTQKFDYVGVNNAQIPFLFSYSGSLTAYVRRDKLPSDYTRSTLPEFMDLGIVHARVLAGDHPVDVSIGSISPGVITSMVEGFAGYRACYSMEHRVSCLKTDNTFEECIGVGEIGDGYIIQSMTIWDSKLMVTKHRWQAGIMTSKHDFYDTSCTKDTAYLFPKPRVLATLGTATNLWTLEVDSDQFIRLKSYTENSFDGKTGFDVVVDTVITENMEYAMQVKDLDLTSIVLCAGDGKVFTLIPVKSSSSDTGNTDEIVLLARMYSESGDIQASADIVVDDTWSFYKILQGHTSYTSRVWRDPSPLIIGFLGEVYEIDYSSDTFAISRIPSSHLNNLHFMKISSGFIAFDSKAVVAPVSDTCKSGFTQVYMDRTIASTLHASYKTELCAHECFIRVTCKAYFFEAGECRHVSIPIQKTEDIPHRSACKRLETPTTKELYTIRKGLAHASSTAQFTALLRGFSKLAESGDEAIGYHAVLGQKQDNYWSIEYRLVPYVTLYNGDDVVIQWDPDDSNHEWPDRIFGIQSNYTSEIRFFEHGYLNDQSDISTLNGGNYAEFRMSAETFVIVVDLCASGGVELRDDTSLLKSLTRTSSSCNEEYAVIYRTPTELKVYNPAVESVTTSGGGLRIRIQGDGKIIQMFGVDSMTDFDLRQLKNVNSKGESKGITNTWKRQYRHIPGNLVRGNPKPFPVFLHIDGGSKDQRSVSLDALQMRPVLTVSGTEDVGDALLTNFYLPLDSELGELGLKAALTGDDVDKWKRLHITVGVDRGNGCRVSFVEVDESGSEVPGDQGIHTDRLKELGCTTEQGQCHLEVPYSFRDANTAHSVGLKVKTTEECDATNIEAWIAPLTTLWECEGESFWSEDEKKCQECVTDRSIDEACPTPGTYVPGCDALVDLTQTGCEPCPGTKNDLNEWASDKICILECIDGVSFGDNGVCTACSTPLTQVDCGGLDPETGRGRRVQECSKTEDAKCVLCDEIQKSIFSSNERFVEDTTGNTVCNTTCKENFYRDLTPPYYCRPCQELDTLKSELSLQRGDDTFYRFRKCGKFKKAEFQKCEVVCDTCEDFEYVVTNCTSSTNVECARCIECSDTEFETRECDGIHNRVCQSCRLCPVGQEMSVDCTSHADRECQDCETGKYKDSVGNVACTTCSDTCGQGQWTKTFCTKETNRECRECTQCDPGYYVSTPCTNTTDTICSICSDGTFSEDGNECKPCRDCPYSSIKMSSCSKTADTKCEPCPPNMTSEVGSYECLCAVGFTEEDGNCTACPAATYKTIPGPGPCAECQQESGIICSESQYLILCGGSDEGKCETCPQGSTSPSGSMSREDCKCALGEGVDSTGICSPCEPGTYKSELNLESCSPCPESKTTEHTGSVNISECVCPPGSYLDSGSCQTCPVGHYKQNHGNQDCTPCSDTFTTELGGSASAASCVCSPGSYVNTDSCELCPQGKYKPEFGTQACTSCSDTLTTEVAGSVNESHCVCLPGFYFDSSCQHCQVGKYKSEYGNEVCTACSDTLTTELTGSVSESHCVCLPGTTFSDSGSCQDCSIGKFKSAYGRQSCTACPTNKTTLYTGTNTSSECQCRPNSWYCDGDANCEHECCSKFAEINLAVNRYQCREFYCPYAQYVSGDLECTACGDCPAGEYRVGCADAADTLDSAGRCDPCATGTFKTTSGSGVCESCDHRPPVCEWYQFKVGCGGSDPGNCQNCPGESYYVDGVCTPCAGCPAGQYRIDCGVSTAGTCPSCEAGTYKTSTGSEGCQNCTADCGAGQFLSGCAGASPGTCASCGGCPAGEYRVNCEEALPGSCQSCDSGTYKTSTGSEECQNCSSRCPIDEAVIGCGGDSTGTCLACPDGEYIESAACVSCPGCPEGQFRVECTGVDAGRCEPCLFGTYKTSTGSEACLSCDFCASNERVHGCGDSGCQVSRHSFWNNPPLTCSGGSSEGTCQTCVEELGSESYLGTGSSYDANWGEYFEFPDNKFCGSCHRNCGYDKWLQGCGGNESGTCRDCPTGKYHHGFAVTDPDSCFPCTTCSGNFGVVGCSGYSAGTCEECAEDECAVDGFCVSDPPCGCPKGQDSIDCGTCTNCTAGSYKNTTCIESCSTCVASTYSEEGASLCSPCATGTASADGAASCTACTNAQNLRVTWYHNDDIIEGEIYRYVPATGIYEGSYTYTMDSGTSYMHRITYHSGARRWFLHSELQSSLFGLISNSRQDNTAVEWLTWPGYMTLEDSCREQIIF